MPNDDADDDAAGRVYMGFSLGGTLAADKLPELTRLAEIAAAGFYGDKIGDLIAEALAGKHPLRLDGETDSHDPREDLITFCQANGLAFSCFWHDSDPWAEWDRGIVHWRPGMPEPVDVGATMDRQPWMTLLDLQSRAAEGATLADVIAELAAAEPEQLPPFALVPDPTVANAAVAAYRPWPW